MTLRLHLCGNIVSFSYLQVVLMVDNFSPTAFDRGEQLKANFYQQSFLRLHNYPANKKFKLPAHAKGECNASDVSSTAPNWFRHHPNVGVVKTGIDRGLAFTDAFTKPPTEFLNSDGSRKTLPIKDGTAISEETPTWFHTNSKYVTEVPLPIRPYPQKKGGFKSSVSKSGPTWMHAKHIDTIARHERNLWAYDYVKPDKCVRLERDSAVSNESPSWFRVTHVPVSSVARDGSLQFNYYNHGMEGEAEAGHDGIFDFQAVAKNRVKGAPVPLAHMQSPVRDMRGPPKRSPAKTRKTVLAPIGRPVEPADKGELVKFLRRQISNEQQRKLKMLKTRLKQLQLE